MYKPRVFTGDLQMQQSKNRIWNLKASDEFITRLQRASIALDRPAAQIAREAINKELDKLAKRYPQIDQPQPEERPAAAVAA